MTLTIHRGTHEIGGSCVEIRTDKAKILIDLGMPLDFEKQTKEEQALLRSRATEWCKGVDAIFLSHAHSDHYGFLDSLAENTPIYATADTFAMIALDGIYGKDQTQRLKRCPIECFKSYELFGLKVTAYPIDHSAYGACSLLFEYNNQRLLYSGDIRLHGVKGVLYKLLPQEIDYLLLEGTNVLRSSRNSSEREVVSRFVEAFSSDPKALNLVWCSSKNIDRICAIFRACRRTGKTLVIDPYVANVLSAVAKQNPKIPSATTSQQIKVFFPSRVTSQLTKIDAQRYIYSLCPKNNKVTRQQISATPGNYVIIVRPSLLDFLQNIEAEHICFIQSIWSGYWSNPQNERFRTWVEQHCQILPDIHSSGHADTQSLRRIVEFIKPRTIIPIHTDSPDSFAELFPKYNIIYPQDGEQISLTTTNY